MSEWTLTKIATPPVHECDGYDSSDVVLAMFDPATNEQPYEVVLYRKSNGSFDDDEPWEAWFIATTMDVIHAPLWWQLISPPVEAFDE